MTSPNYDPAFAVRMRTAAAAVGDRPGMALTLAGSDLPEADINMVGGFTRALDNAQLVSLSRLSGARTELSPDDRSQLDAMGVAYDDVNDGQDDDERNWLEKIFDGGATALANTGEWLSGLPVIGQAFDLMMWLNQAAKLPARLIASGLDTSNDDEIDAGMRAQGYDPSSPGDYLLFMLNQGDSLYHDLDGIRETHGDDLVDLAVAQQMDPEAFAENLASLSEDRQKLAMSDEFAKVADLVDRQHVSPGRDIARLLTLGNTDNAAFTAISGTLDGAYTLLLDPTLMVGKAASGVRALDASGQAIRDVTRLTRRGGRLDQVRGINAMTRGFDSLTGGRFRQGLHDATDQAGIRGLLAVDDEGRAVTSVGQGTDEFLRDAKLFHQATDDAERATIFARMQARHRPLMPLLDEVRGRRILPPAPMVAWEHADDALDSAALVDDVPVITDLPPLDYKPTDVVGGGHLGTQGETIWDAAARKGITPLEEFADYFASTAGLLRLAGGGAAMREIILPGRVALRQRVAGRNAARRQTGLVGRGAARRNDEVYDHEKPYALLPHEAEEHLHQAMDELEKLRASGQIDEIEYKRRGDHIYEEMRGKAGFIAKQRARFEARARKVSSLLPTVQAIDLTSAGSTEQVRRFARLYMNKTEADRLAALYAAGDLGQRRQVLHGVIEQTFHASGLSRSEAGLKHIERFRADQAAEAKRAYGLAGSDVISTPAGSRHVALLPSQLSDRVLIPDFRSLQYLSTKLAVGGAFTKLGHLRSIATSEGVDAVSAAIKMGWITSGAGGLRNALDEVANAVLRAEGASLLRGRAAFSEATRSRRATRAEIRRATSLQARILTSIPRALRGIPRTVNDVLIARGLGRMMSFTHQKVDALAIKHAEELVDDMQAELLDRTVTGAYHVNDAINPNAEAQGMHAAGLHAAEVKHNGGNVKYEFQGWGEVEVNGGVGLDNFAHNLGMAFQDLTSPAHVALRAITTGGDVYGDIVAYMQTPAMRHFLRNAEFFKVTSKGKPVKTAEDQLDALHHYAENLTAHVTMLVSGKGSAVGSADELAGAAARYENDVTQPRFWEDPDYQVGPINPDLVAKLQRGDIPDRTWLKENLADDEMPSHVIGKVFAPINPKHKTGQLLQGYTSMLAVGYEYLVTRQIRAISRNPMMASAYDQARRNLAGYEQHLRDAGFADDIAEKIARRSARVQAEQLVIKSIDDPTLSTQYAMLARNVHAFARAQEDWLRRWGRTIRDNPTLVQRAQLYLHGAEAAGIVERDDEGNLIFTYPGSGFIINQVGKLASLLPGMGDVKLPLVPDLTSRLIFLNPSLDNPAGFSAMPLVSIPWELIAGSTGADQALLVSSMDRVINGELGAGREWYEKILPGFANRIISGVLSDEDPASQYASAWTAALMNLEAAGRTPAADASASEIARFQNDLKAQISNQMVLRAIFGFVLPAAPSVPVNDTTDVDTGKSILQPDYVWEKAGVDTLKDEARRIFGSMPYEEALVWWAENHPGELVYQVGTTPRTVVGDSEAQAPATIAAAKWMQENPYLLERYGSKGGIATYFMPQGAGSEGDFSMDAYRAQLETGIREYKTLDQFFEDIVTQRGEAVYYDSKDDIDAMIAEATAIGNQFEVDRLEEQWAVAKQQILGANPLLAAKFAEYATSGVARERTVAQLNALLDDPQAVTAIGPQAGGVAELLLAQRQYEAERQAVYGERGWFASSKREAAKADFESAIAAVVARFPGLADLARGAFRVPN